MNEFKPTPEGEAIHAKATEIAQFLKDNINKMPDEVTALFEQIGIKDDSDESELLVSAQDAMNYIAMSDEKRGKIDDMVQSLRSAIEGEEI